MDPALLAIRDVNVYANPRGDRPPSTDALRLIELITLALYREG